MDEAYRELFERAAELEREKRWEEAVEALRELSRREPRVSVCNALGWNLWLLGRNAEAEECLMFAARHRPDNVVTRSYLGNVYASQGRIAQAELEYRTALAFQPNYAQACFGLGSLLLSIGDYARGWPLMESRLRLEADSIPRATFSFPEWVGQPLEGKTILIWYEQGFGDQIQMARFAQLLKARGAAHVALGCRPPLVHLFSTLTGADEIIPVPRGTYISIDRYDYWTRYFSLPERLGVTLQNLPRAPYLSAPADRRERWRGYSGVGLAWRSSPTGSNARNKSLRPDDARRLLDLGAVSLDPEATGVSDFADTAAIIEQLDLVISIDSAVAHLAGAMGKPTWTVLPAALTDWRWLRDRTDSPWYPGMRLYRQTTPGDWSPVIDQLLADLGERIRAPLGRQPQAAPAAR